MPRSRYEADNGDIHPIIMSAARLAVAGTPPAGAVSNDIQVKISKGDREAGIRPRRVVLTRTIGTAPNQFTRRTTLPVLTPAAFNSAAFAPAAEITYGGVAWTVLRREGEDF